MSFYGSDDDDEVFKSLKLMDKTEKPGLPQIIFSWSLKDVFNHNLFKEKVQKIPQTFTSLEHYFGAFKEALKEETRADLCSSLKALSQAAHAELELIEQISVSKQLLYRLSVKNLTAEKDDADDDARNCTYEPMDADIFVLTRTKPTHASDLSRNPASYMVGYVVRNSDSEQQLSDDQYLVKLSSKLELGFLEKKHFIVFR